MKRLAVTVALCLAAQTPAHADIRIISSPGGNVGGYLKFFSDVKRSGQLVIIDGPCLSACTLVLSTLPRSRVCVTSRAVLGFHAPVVADRSGHVYHSRQITQAVIATYPSNVRSWIKHHGGLRSAPIYLRGKELTSMYRRC